MNYNANAGTRQPFGRKVKRVSDVNSMGYNPYDNPSPQSPGNLHPNLEPSMNTYQQGFSGANTYEPQIQSNPSFQTIPTEPQNLSSYDYKSVPSAPNLGVFTQPVVQDMALQYGQQLAGAGKHMIKNEVERYIPVSKLKYYFAVDTKYVLSKLVLLVFPFMHKDWAIKYEQDGPIQPRYEVNAPDLYIPTMGYITYVLVAGLALGIQERFTPEQIGILASSALAWVFIELAVYYCTLYIIQIQTTLKALDMLAYSGYKFVAIILSVLLSLLGGAKAYYCALIYSNLALAFFLTRSLKVLVLTGQNYYDGNVRATGHRRRVYLLIFMAAVQPVLSWWLSYHLVIVQQ